MSKPSIDVKDFTEKFLAAVKKMKKFETLVGIPEEDSKRDESDGINNAALLFINEYGSPANNIPARPVVKIGIKQSKSDVVDEFRKAARDGLSRGDAVVQKYYERAGIIASNSIKNVINNQIGIQGPSEATLKIRKEKGFKGTKSLIVTGQMRNAITYVVQEK